MSYGPFLVYGLNLPSYPPPPVGPGLGARRRRRLALLPAGPTLAPDLVAAVIARLRSYSGGSVASAFGDVAGPGTARFWAGNVLGSPALPWLRVERPMSRRRFFSEANFIETGQLQISLFAVGSTRAQALSDLIAKGEPGDAPGALDDPPLMFRGGRLMKFRLSPSSAGWAGGPGVGTPGVYQRVLLFDYEFSGQIS